MHLLVAGKFIRTAQKVLAPLRKVHVWTMTLDGQFLGMSQLLRLRMIRMMTVLLQPQLLRLLQNWRRSFEHAEEKKIHRSALTWASSATKRASLAKQRGHRALSHVIAAAKEGLHHLHNRLPVRNRRFPLLHRQLRAARPRHER